jgi:hypothetical protein
MYGPHLCNEYIKELDAFINFMKKDMLDNVRGNLCYTCKHCRNEKKYRADDVLRSHLIKHGFMEDYRCWNEHEEEGLNEAEMRDTYLKREVPTAVEEDHEGRSMLIIAYDMVVRCVHMVSKAKRHKSWQQIITTNLNTQIS